MSITRIIVLGALDRDNPTNPPQFRYVLRLDVPWFLRDRVPSRERRVPELTTPEEDELMTDGALVEVVRTYQAAAGVTWNQIKNNPTVRDQVLADLVTACDAAQLVIDTREQDPMLGWTFDETAWAR